ncbi:hypothetical protein ACFP81_13420 [Deinococcus lacus]|uniref:Uncharacterized protein n=1 Tax=Deinococcus lacus TaxID=392561 RepID=A0ABW1YHH3_9DEIO
MPDTRGAEGRLGLHGAALLGTGNRQGGQCQSGQQQQRAGVSILVLLWGRAQTPV